MDIVKKYKATARLKDKCPFRTICRISNIPHSSYYKWLKVKDKIKLKGQEIQNKIKNYHELFNHILGYRRMTLWLNIIGKKNYNVKRIRRHMRLLHIASAIRRKKTNYLRYKPE